jgi:hypothetical protein
MKVYDTVCDAFMICSPNYFMPGTSRPYSTSIRIALGRYQVDPEVWHIHSIRESKVSAFFTAVVDSYQHISIIVEFGNKRVLFKRPDGAILVKGRRIGQNWLLNVF